jgi:hypothetical protein
MFLSLFDAPAAARKESSEYILDMFSYVMTMFDLLKWLSVRFGVSFDCSSMSYLYVASA